MDELAEHLVDLYDAWFAAITAPGTGRLPDLLADEWRYTNYDGMVRSKSEYLDWAAGLSSGPRFEGPYDVSVTRPGGLALVLGGYRVDRADETSVELRFTGLWEHRDGRWQCLAHHNSAVATPS